MANFAPLISITKDTHQKSIGLFKKNIVCANKIEGVKATFPALAFKVRYADNPDYCRCGECECSIPSHRRQGLPATQDENIKADI